MRRLYSLSRVLYIKFPFSYLLIIIIEETMRHFCVFCIMLLLGLTANAQESVPQVIPALQSWKAASGKLVLPENGKIVVAPKDTCSLGGDCRYPGSGFKGNVRMALPDRDRKA